MVLRRALALTAFSSALVVSQAARASPSSKLVYVRGPGAQQCPSEEELRRAVADRIGYDPFFASAQKTVVVQMMRDAGSYRGRVQIVADDGKLRGERELPSVRDCTEMVASLALVVSLALDDLDAEPPSPPATDAPLAEPTPKESPPPTPPPEDKPAPPPPPPRPGSPSFQRAISVGPAVTVGWSPSPAVAAELAASLRWGRLGVRFDGKMDVPAGLDVAPGARVVTNAVVGSASGCFRGSSLFTCAGVGSGVVFARSEGVRQPASDRAPVVIVVGRVGIDVPVASNAYIEPSLELGVNLLRHQVAIDDRHVYGMAGVWAGAGFHVGWRFF